MSHVSELLKSTIYTSAGTPAQYNERARLLIKAIASDVKAGVPVENAVADAMVLSGKSASVSLQSGEAMYSLLSDEVKADVTRATFAKIVKSYRYDADEVPAKEARARAYMVSQGMDVSLLAPTPAAPITHKEDINPDEMSDDEKINALVKLGVHKKEAVKIVHAQRPNAQP